MASGIATAVAAYLLGSVPTGYLAGRARGIDIRKVGSGNIGATNVFRALGKPAGALVLLADTLKGWMAVAVLPGLMQWICGLPGGGMELEHGQLLAGLAVVLGHNYTCWLWFKGGKGIATSAGVLLAIVPWALLIILGVWLTVFLLSRYVSLASICAALVLPLATWLTERSGLLLGATAALTVLAVYRHRSNIGRLLKGTENRFRVKEAAP